jgi:hypothetical protein
MMHNAPSMSATIHYNAIVGVQFIHLSSLGLKIKTAVKLIQVLKLK